MSIEDRGMLGNVRQWTIPGAGADGQTKRSRVSRHGEQYVKSLYGNRLHALADEGSYFVATNPTPGTAIIGIAAADGLDDTESLVFLRNDATAAEGTRIYLDYLKLTVEAVGTNGADFAYAMHVDTGTSRRGTGGSAITPVNPNMQSSNTADCTLVFGAVATAAASASQRLVSHGPLREVIKVVSDTYLFTFGAEQARDSDQQTDGTDEVHLVRSCPPVVLGPTDQFLFHEFATSQTVAASYQFEMGFWVR